jgi:hypothetical protein
VVTTIFDGRCEESFTVADMLVLRDGSGILISDSFNNRIHHISTATQKLTAFAGTGVYQNADGEALSAALKSPRSMAFDLSTPEPDSVVYIAARQTLRRLTLPTGIASHRLFTLCLSPT